MGTAVHELSICLKATVGKASLSLSWSTGYGGVERDPQGPLWSGCGWLVQESQEARPVPLQPCFSALVAKGYSWAGAWWWSGDGAACPQLAHLSSHGTPWPWAGCPMNGCEGEETFLCLSLYLSSSLSCCPPALPQVLPRASAHSTLIPYCSLPVHTLRSLHVAHSLM